MQGVHAFDPTVRTSIDLESFVAADHFLRRIERTLDLSFIRDLTAACYADGQGRPSIDPEVYFRMQLVAYPETKGFVSESSLGRSNCFSPQSPTVLGSSRLTGGSTR